MGRPATCSCGECQKCKHRVYMRKWQAANPGYAAAAQRARRDGAREYERARYQSDDEFRAKKRARGMVNIRIKKGTMERLPCEVCGASNAEAHHDDYSRPLDVRWLCTEHHLAHHNSLAPF